MRILGIDPGEDIGMSLYDTQTKEDKSWQFNINKGSYTDRPHVSLWLRIRSLQPNVIVCEAFYHVPRYMSLNMITAELVGVIKLYAQTFNCELYMQNRGMKAGWPASKIKMLGLYQPGEDNEDAMDALRHRLVYQEAHDMIEWPTPPK